MAYVYRHIRLDKNEPFYIGIGKTLKRAYSKANRNIHWKRIIEHSSYDVEIIVNNITWEEACEKETELIRFYGRRDLGMGPLVNMTNGGEGVANHIYTDAQRVSMSIGQRGNQKWKKRK